MSSVCVLRGAQTDFAKRAGSFPALLGGLPSVCWRMRRWMLTRSRSSCGELRRGADLRAGSARWGSGGCRSCVSRFADRAARGGVCVGEFWCWARWPTWRPPAVMTLRWSWASRLSANVGSARAAGLFGGRCVGRGGVCRGARCVAGAVRGLCRGVRPPVGLGSSVPGCDIGNARRNPNAQARAWDLPEDAFGERDAVNPPVAGLLRKMDCSRITDSAAAVVLTFGRGPRLRGPAGNSGGFVAADHRLAASDRSDEAG